MFQSYHMMVLRDPSEVDSLMKIAANHRLQCLYKIGVYGNVQQHELYVIGNFWRYWEFLKETRPKGKK